MDGTYPEIMTVHEAAEFLRVPLSTIYMLAQKGKIPAQKVGRHWRFHRAILVNWIAGGYPVALQSQPELTNNQ